MRRKVAYARIDMRTTPQSKYFLELAAFMGGYESLSDFIVQASENRAKEVFDTMEESRELSDQDRDLLLNFLKNPPEPNEKLKAAYQKVLGIYKVDADGRGIYNVDPDLIKNAIDNKRTY